MIYLNVFMFVLTDFYMFYNDPDKIRKLKSTVLQLLFFLNTIKRRRGSVHFGFLHFK